MKQPSFFISHGGGPAFWINWNPPDVFDKLKHSLQSIPSRLPEKPKAILVVTAHWEESEFTVQSTKTPGMIYDYNGFPEHTYKLNYPAPGSPELAHRVVDLLKAKNIPVKEDNTRGFDHGTFVPLLVMYPDADIPVVQLSIKKGYDPEAHYKMGEAIAPLRGEGVLIIGSGFTFHNLREFSDPKNISKGFDDWLNTTLVESRPEERFNRLVSWSQAPGARFCQPKEDHLMPLIVLAGTSKDENVVRFYNERMKKFDFWTSSFQFGLPEKNK